MNRSGLPSTKIIWTGAAKRMSHIVDRVLHPMEEDRGKESGEEEEEKVRETRYKHFFIVH